MPNFLFMADVFDLVEFLGWGSEFALLSFSSFLCPLRVPSDALQLRSAFHDDPIADPVAQSEEALIGVRTFKGQEALVIKMAWRENLEGGRILKRTCICSPDHSQMVPPHPPMGSGRGFGRGLTPVHVVSPLTLRKISIDT